MVPELGCAGRGKGYIWALMSRRFKNPLYHESTRGIIMASLWRAGEHYLALSFGAVYSPAMKHMEMMMFFQGLTSLTGTHLTEHNATTSRAILVTRAHAQWPGIALAVGNVTVTQRMEHSSRRHLTWDHFVTYV